jgi:MerR family transcriptional regulator, thiopeptide resistance regulator
MTCENTHSIGEVARLARVSVRTLHHYDELGLLKPSTRTSSGYRRYSDADLEKLQTILFYRELGFGLEQIRALLSDPTFDRRTALLEQRGQLLAKLERLSATLRLIDKTLASLEGAFSMTKEEMFEVFGDFDPAGHEAEVVERWGDTDAYKESAKRARRYTKADWQRIKAEGEAVNQAIAALMDAGVPATDPRALDAAEAARLQIDRWFYPCSREMHGKLGEMYVSDPRFTATYEKIRPGMARYLNEAIQANAAR